MDLEQGYNLTPSTQERLRLLDWIADQGGTTPKEFVALGALLEGEEREAALALIGHLETLEGNGVLSLQKTLGWGGWSCYVTPRGVELIESLRAERGDLLGRRKASRDAFLHWLYDCTLKGNRVPNSSAFFGSSYGNYFGHQFTGDEVAAASDWLKTEGYITGSLTWNAGIVRPSITTRGERIVESGRSVNDDSPAAANAPSHITTVNVSGTGHNVATHSPGAVQTATVTMSDDNRKLILPVADNLDGLLQAGLLGLDEEQSAEAVEVVSELRRAADEPEVEGGALRRLLEKAKSVAIAGTGAAMGQGVVALAEQSLQGLGLG
ncbi:hypothetical protein [Blastococcus sp. LR1]|uniref:hypothetical protein n=1 Tax=Blastococcus sp. LR1 TaxID=2877000 RepID=UPI001CCBDBFE|nr:hypothetical protein [Blastococcus sp. LR1]MCA0146446.1 hypothetical protein [Blastococcus sp. LR1]